MIYSVLVLVLVLLDVLVLLLLLVLAVMGSPITSEDTEVSQKMTATHDLAEIPR